MMRELIAPGSSTPMLRSPMMAARPRRAGGVFLGGGAPPRVVARQGIAPDVLVEQAPAGGADPVAPAPYGQGHLLGLVDPQQRGGEGPGPIGLHDCPPRGATGPLRIGRACMWNASRS